ncbi:hypothetical protein PR003_g12029 [Phytophthora rubi]|uniref:Uncharacterized protein n=1 Tax=Phytophthora rubi TaxID=129364 RepID=A0A6A3N103_9STRA|nr:hypothetical protein PR002_g8414 [Phytophthora rubi]KAE9037542.1 hypothetical protein PR001_g8332 [Phytophthora rubi]KAE9337396.1 hypothetical protein PR003_g12029 [Phytophthora rubi]
MVVRPLGLERRHGGGLDRDDVVLDVERGTRRKLVLVLDLVLRKESPSQWLRLSAKLGPYRRIESSMTPDRMLVRRWSSATGSAALTALRRRELEFSEDDVEEDGESRKNVVMGT